LNISELSGRLRLLSLTPELEGQGALDVTNGYASDLLSDVLANALGGAVLITVQVHMNVIAVSVHAGLVAVIFSNGRLPDEPVRAKAVGEKIRLYSSQDSSFELAGKLYECGLRGGRV